MSEAGDITTGDPSRHSLTGMQATHQLGGPLGTALSIGTSAPHERHDGYFKETMHEVSKHPLGFDGLLVVTRASNICLASHESKC